MFDIHTDTRNFYPVATGLLETKKKNMANKNYIYNSKTQNFAGILETHFP